MVSSPKDVSVRASMNPEAYVAGAEKVTWATKQMMREQEAADRKWRSMQAAHQAALDEDAARTKKVADAKAAAERAAAEAAAEAERKKQDACKKTGQALTAAGAVILTGLGVATRAAQSWESAWAGVTKTVDGTPEELAQVEAALRDLTKVLPSTHEEIAAVAEAAGQLGVKTGAIATFTKTMIDLGQTTNLSADDAATAIAQMANVMDASMLTSGDGVQRLGSTLVALGNAGASTERDIMEMAARLTGAGKLVGASSAQVLALASAMASMGIHAQAGGGVASRVLQSMYSAVVDGGDKMREFARVAGMSATDFATAFRTDPVRALAAVTGGLNTVEASGGNVMETLKDLGFKSSETQRVMLQLKGSGDLLTESLDLANDAWTENSALVDEANKRYETSEAKVAIAKNAIHDAAIDLGATFLPMVAAAAEGVAWLMQAFTDLPGPVKTAVAILGGLVGVAATATGGFLLLAPKIKAAQEVLHTLSITTPRVTGAVKGLGAGLATIAPAALLAGAAVKSMVDEARVGKMRMEELADAYDVAAGRFTDGAIEKAIEALQEKRSWVGWLREMGGGFETAADAAEYLGLSLRDVGDAMLEPDGGQLYTDLMGLREAFRGNRQEALDYAKTIGLTLPEDHVMAQKATELLTDKMGINLKVTDEARHKAEQLAEATGETGDAAEGAASAQDVLTQAITDQADAQGELTEEQAKWLAQMAEEFNSFTSADGPYQAVIDKNRETAEAAAAATKSSKDSWEDYYDGQSVSSQDYIAELQRQVEAQERWAANIEELTGRLAQTMPADMQSAVNRMMDELMTLGPEGAAQVQLLHDMSDDELRQVVELFQRQGLAAGQEWADKVESARVPTLTVDTSPADAAMRAWRNRWNGVTVNAVGRLTTAAVATGGPIPGFPTGGRLPGTPPADPLHDNLLGIDTTGMPRVLVQSGEWVIRRSAADYYGDDILSALNRREVPKSVFALPERRYAGLAAGGPVPAAVAGVSPGGGPARVVNLQVTVHNPVGESTVEAINDALARDSSIGGW